MLAELKSGLANARPASGFSFCVNLSGFDKPFGFEKRKKLAV
jgi:hypothetical protein